MTAPTPLLAALEALAQCRVLIEDEREVRLNSYTVGGDPATMDTDEAAEVADCDNCLIAIDEVIPTLRAALADAGWRGIESAPTNGNVFLGYDAYGEFQIARLDEGMFRSFETGKRVDLNVWMPLPSPPTEGTEP